jgi:hypothetical protein
MRIVIIAMIAFLAACGQPQPETPDDASAGSSGVGRVPEVAFTLESEALVGLWSFDRVCGNYDLVLRADGGADHYEVSSEGMVTSYAGTWATTDNNRVVLTLRLLDAQAQPTGETLTYNLNVEAPVTDDLIGDFVREGGVPLAITARRCPEEDRD